MVFTISLAVLSGAYAGSATWKPTPTNGDWNTAANWTPNTVPNSLTDVATFGTSAVTEVTLTTDFPVNYLATLQFNPGADSFFITTSEGASLSLVGDGIVNNSGTTQQFTARFGSSIAFSKVWAAHDCGRALNPVSVEGQIIGSVWMGMGQALTEEMVWKDGLLMNPGLLEYRSPSSVESPEIEPIIVESIDPEGPFGAKECSEGSLAATIPAIANAIHDAVGIRLRESPFTPERVLAALRAKKNAKTLDLTEGVDPTAPVRLREHGGSLWFKGKGPERHELDPARRAEVAE